MLKSLNLEGQKTLLLTANNDKNVLLSSRNLQRTNVMRATDANTYHVLNAGHLIICESGLAELNKMLGE
jgi:large subunit ribosomal protein L4